VPAADRHARRASWWVAHVGGIAGHQDRHDLATSIPAVPTNAARRTSQYRRGIKFAKGQVLKPSDFVRTFERPVHGAREHNLLYSSSGRERMLTKGLRT